MPIARETEDAFEAHGTPGDTQEHELCRETRRRASLSQQGGRLSPLTDPPCRDTTL